MAIFWSASNFWFGDDLDLEPAVMSGVIVVKCVSPLGISVLIIFEMVEEIGVLLWNEFVLSHLLLLRRCDF